MVMRDLVQEVHEDLIVLRRSVSIHEPILGAVIDNLIKLTTITDEPESSAAQEDAFQAGTNGGAKVEAGGPCQHKVLSVYGKCIACGECQHTNVKHGYCLTCDKEIRA